MSILREQQIKEILDADNFINRIVMSRYGANIKDYEENIKPVEVLDKTLDDKNKDEIDNFVNYINKLYLLLYSWEIHPVDMLKLFANEKEESYKTFLADINITKPFQMWEKLTNEYVNPAMNQVSRELIMNNLSKKLLPYLKKINEYLYNNVEILANLIPYDLGLMGEVGLYNVFFGEQFEPNNENDVKNLARLKKIYPERLIPSMLEALAFYKNIENSIETSKIQPLTKQDVAFEMTSIINKLHTDLPHNYRNAVIRKINQEITDIDVPELTPYFKAGYDDFTRAYDELDALGGLAQPVAPVAPVAPIYEDPFAHLLPNFERERMMPEGVNPEDMPWWMQMYHYMNPAPPVERGAWQLPEGIGRGKPKGKGRGKKYSNYKNKQDALEFDDSKNEMFIA